jgi:hypothetical protein
MNDLSSAGLTGFATGAHTACRGRSLWSRGHGRVPVEEAGATVAGEQFAFAKLVPGLGTDAYATAGALLIFSAGNTGAAGGAEAVEAGEQIGLDEGPEGFALGSESNLLAFNLDLAETYAFASLVESNGQRLDLEAGCGENGFLSFGALQAGEGLVFKALGFGLGKVELVLAGRDLIGGVEGVLLGAVTGCLLAVSSNLALQASAERFLVAEGGGGVGGQALGSGEGSLGLGNFSRQGARGLRKAGTIQLHRLQLYEIFNLRLHPRNEVYGIGRGFIK